MLPGPLGGGGERPKDVQQLREARKNRRKKK
jgi:hypothetical protein